MRKSRSPRSTIVAFGLLLLSISLTASLPLSATRFAMAGVSSVGKCEAAFLAQSRVSFEKAESLLNQALRKRDFEVIPRRALKNLTTFDQSHPDRSHGFTTGEMHQARYRGETVIIKRAPIQEVQLAYALSELGVGAKFLGVADFCDCYIISFVPNALLIKPETLDRRTQQFLKNGFRLTESAKDKMRLAVQSLAKLGIATNDLNFLVDMNGQVTLIDPGSFYKGSTSEAQFTATWNLNKLEEQFTRLHRFELENALSISPPSQK